MFIILCIWVFLGVFFGCLFPKQERYNLTSSRGDVKAPLLTLALQSSFPHVCPSLLPLPLNDRAQQYPSVTVPLSRFINQEWQESTLQTAHFGLKSLWTESQADKEGRGVNGKGKQTKKRRKVWLERPHLCFRDESSVKLNNASAWES